MPTATGTTVRERPPSIEVAGIRHQLTAWRRLRSDHRLRREMLAQLQRRRAGRHDLLQFDVLEDGERAEALAVRGELLVRREHLTSPAVAGLITRWDLRPEPVGCLDGRVVRLLGAPDPGRIAALAAEVAAGGLPISINHVTPMGGVVMKGGTAPTPVAAGPTFTGGAATGPVVAVLDTGITAQPRSDGWLAGLVGTDNVDPLDTVGRAGELDPGAGHGTFAAGIVQQVAPDANVRAYRVMDSAGIGSEVAVACAMLRAAAEGADVINLSLGTQALQDRPPVALEVALELLAQQHPDVLVVAAAGNDGEERPCWPAAFPDVVAVAGLDADLQPSDWSNRGDWVSCSTLGEGVVSTYVTGRHPGDDGPTFGSDAWASWTGTSFAAPQVAGALAARCTAEPGTTPRQAMAALLADGRPVADHGQALRIL